MKIRHEAYKGWVGFGFPIGPALAPNTLREWSRWRKLGKLRGVRWRYRGRDHWLWVSDY